MSKRIPISLEDVNHSQHNIASFAIQRDAAAFAKKNGWRVSDTHLVRFRWQQVWVLAYEVPGALVMLTKDGSTVDLPWDAKFVRSTP
jgi:hypothetical protein